MLAVRELIFFIDKIGITIIKIIKTIIRKDASYKTDVNRQALLSMIKCTNKQKMFQTKKYE